MKNVDVEKFPNADVIVAGVSFSGSELLAAASPEVLIDARLAELRDGILRELIKLKEKE